MEGCDVAIANLTPFRGPSADAGTVRFKERDLTRTAEALLAAIG